MIQYWLSCTVKRIKSGCTFAWYITVKTRYEKSSVCQREKRMGRMLRLGLWEEEETDSIISVCTMGGRHANVSRISYRSSFLTNRHDVYRTMASNLWFLLYHGVYLLSEMPVKVVHTSHAHVEYFMSTVKHSCCNCPTVVMMWINNTVESAWEILADYSVSKMTCCGLIVLIEGNSG